MECPEFPKIPEICVKMIRRVNDEEGNLFAAVISGVINVAWNCNRGIINACHSQGSRCSVPVTSHLVPGSMVHRDICWNQQPTVNFLIYGWRIIKPTRCHLLYLLCFLDTQHVSGINMSIFRSLRLCCWTTTLAVFFLVCCVLELGCGSARVVSRLPAAWIPP